MFDETAERKRVEREREAADWQWRDYARRAEEYFIVTELPQILADFWVAAQTAGTPTRVTSAGERVVRAAVYEGQHNPESVWTDRLGRLMHDNDAEPSPQWVCTHLGRALAWGHPGPPLKDADLINRTIRAHYEDYLKKQL
jgi:hypothetical protein